MNLQIIVGDSWDSEHMDLHNIEYQECYSVVSSLGGQNGEVNKFILERPPEWYPPTRIETSRRSFYVTNKCINGHKFIQRLTHPDILNLMRKRPIE